MKRARPTDYSCDLCEFQTKKKSNLELHIKTEKHERNVRIVEAEKFEFESFDESEDVCDQDGLDSAGGVFHGAPGAPGPDNLSGISPAVDIDAFDHMENEPVDRPTSPKNEWFPFNCKTDMLLYILLHSKTHTLSDETAHFIWFIMREAGINMPSISSIKTMSFGNLNTESLLQRSESEDGIPFWYIKPSSLLSLSLSHPETSHKLIRYGRTSSTSTSYTEQRDGSRLKELNCVSAKKNGTIFYTGDFVVDRRTKRIGKIENFFQDSENCMLAELRLFEQMEYDQNSLICCNNSIEVYLEQLDSSQIKTENIKFYSYDAENIQLNMIQPEERQQLIATNSLTKNNNMVVSVPVNIFLDDTSAHRSKRWKPLHCIQQQLSGLPISVRQSSNSVKFIAASSEVKILEMMKAIADDLREVKKNGIQVYDAKDQEEVTITTDLALCVCDFNMMAEAANHMGAATKKFCPRCDADKSTCINKGTERNPEDTIRVLERLAINNSKEVRQRYGLKPYSNCLWEIINPHRDIPVGMLHWMFLGLGNIY